MLFDASESDFRHCWNLEKETPWLHTVVRRARLAKDGRAGPSFDTVELRANLPAPRALPAGLAERIIIAGQLIPQLVDPARHI